MKRIVILLFFCGLGSLVSQISPNFQVFSGQNPSKNVSHALLDSLVSRHVTDDGWVNYRRLRTDSAMLNRYLDTLAAHAPDPKTWSRNDQMAYWINAYNAFTLQIVLRHYPLKSIKDIRNGIPFVNTTWDIKFIQIGDQKLDLNNIEHRILRRQFKDPRIHFAINCASVSCPKLRNEAYVGDRLEAQLDDQARDFLSDLTKNIITPHHVQLSRIFQWYGFDFPKNKIDYLNQYSPIKIDSKAKKSYLEYDWNLNDQP